MEESVVVILLNYNQNEYTLRCVESLLDSDYSNFSIMLVDNGSTKNNVEELSNSLPVDKRLIFKKIEVNVGYPGGSNYAFEEALKLNPDFFLIMNNDTIIDKMAIKELVKACNKYDGKARVMGKVYHYDQPNTLQFVGNKFINRKMLNYTTMGVDEIDNGQYDKVELRDLIDDIFVLQPVDLYKEIGGYSTYFWMNSVEKDLSLRAIKGGYKLVFTPHAKLWHKGSISLGGRDMNPKIAYWNMQSKLLLRFIHLPRFNFIIFYINAVISVSRTFIKSRYLKLFKGVDIYKYARAKYAGLLYFNKWLFKRNNNNGYNPF